MQFFLQNYYLKNKIKKTKRRFKWRKPKLFFFTKNFIKSLNKKRWMKFKVLKYARRSTINKNKYQKNYINYLSTFLNKSSFLNEDISKMIFFIINNHINILGNYILTTKLNLSKYINKQNLKYIFLICWFYKRKQRFLNSTYLNFKIKKFYHPWIFSILKKNKQIFNQAKQTSYLKKHFFNNSKQTSKLQIWKYHYTSKRLKRQLKFKILAKKTIKNFYKPYFKNFFIKKRLKPYTNHIIKTKILKLNYFIKNFYGCKKIGKIVWKVKNFIIRKPRWQTRPWKWNNQKPTWWNEKKKKEWNSKIDILYSYKRRLKYFQTFLKIPVSQGYKFITILKKLLFKVKNYKLKVILFCLYNIFNQKLLKKTTFLKIRQKVFFIILKLLYKLKLKNSTIKKIILNKIAKIIGYKFLIKKINPILVKKIVTLINYIQSTNITKLKYNQKYKIRWNLLLKKIQKQSFKISYRLFNKILATGRFFIKSFINFRTNQNIQYFEKRKSNKYKLKQLTHLLKIYRKCFKLNLLKTNKNIRFKLNKNKKLNIKIEKKFNWFQTIKFLDRQKKRRLYKQKARTFNPTQYKNYKNILKQNSLQLYRFKYVIKKNLHINSHINFKNIYIAKFNKNVLANKKNLYLYFKNSNKNHTYFYKNTLYNNLYKKNINYLIKKNLFNMSTKITPLYNTISNYKNYTANSITFNKFISKIYKKHKYYVLRRLLKRQKKQTAFFVKHRFNYKKLLKQKNLSFIHLTQRAYKKRRFKRSYRWKIKKFIRLRKNSLRFTRHKIKYAKSKFKYSPPYKHSLKTYFIKNVLNYQLKNLITNPTVKTKYINVFKELFFDRWFLHVFNKKKQTAIFFDFLIKQHSNFISLFKTNPFIFLKKAKQFYYKKYKKHRVILRHYQNKIYKYITVAQKKIFKILKQKNIKLNYKQGKYKKNKYEKLPKIVQIKIKPYKKKIKILKNLYKIIEKRYIKTRIIWRKINKRIVTFKKMKRRERFLSNHVIKMTALKRQAFTSINSINYIYKNFINFFKYQIISTKQRTYFNKKIFINFLVNNYSFLKTKKNALIYLLKIIKVDTKKQLIKNIQSTYYDNDIKTRLKTFYINRRTRLNRYRSLQLYSKYRFNKRLFLNRKSRLRFGLTQFLRKWKHVQSIYAQKKFIVKFFLQKYYKNLNPTDFYKLRQVIKYKTNKLKYWHAKIENRADIILAKLKFTSNLWLSRYLITSKKIFFNNTLQTKTNKIYKEIPFITIATQPTQNLFINNWQNLEANKNFYQVPLNFYQKTGDTEQFLNYIMPRKLQRYTKNNFAQSTMSIFNNYKTTLRYKKPKMSRFLPTFKKFRRIKFFRKKRTKKTAKKLKIFNQGNISDITRHSYNKNINFGAPKILLYRTRKNNKGPLSNLVQHNKYRTSYIGSWYSMYLTKLQLVFNQFSNKKNYFVVAPQFMKIQNNNIYIQTIISQLTQSKVTAVEQPIYNNPTTTLFNTTKSVSTGILANNFNSWRRTFELKLHRRFKYKNRKRPRILRTNFTKNHNNTLLTYDFLNFLRFSKI